MRKKGLIVLILIFVFTFSSVAMADQNQGLTNISTMQQGQVMAPDIDTSASATVDTSSTSNVSIDNNSVTKIKNINRQFPNTVQPQAPQTPQYFGPWTQSKHPWNYLPLKKGEYTRCQVEKMLHNVNGFFSSKVDEKVITILYEMIPQNKAVVTDVEPEENRAGLWHIGDGVVRMKPDGTTREALAILLDEAMQKGANLIFMRAISWQDTAEATSKYVGLGGGTSGVIDNEKMGVQVSGIIGAGKGSVTKEAMPWIQAEFYRDGNAEAKGEIVAPTVVTKTKEIPIQEKFSPISSPSY